MQNPRFLLALVLGLALPLAGCGSEPVPDQETPVITGGGETTVEVIRDDVSEVDDVVPMSVLTTPMNPTEGNTAAGTVVFRQEGEEVVVEIAITGLEPNTRHGFHVHETGDCSAPDGTSAGGHYNPEGHDHALPDANVRHAGDMGNVEADADGNANMTLRFTNISLAGTNPIQGRAVILHAGADDGGQPTGNAGARIACGVIPSM